ncbi:CBS domain-containing protein [Candidatus Woesearchaeota archaeon]|nr:CBS domain-containing protein [Candidatus Woesearchaeota archaeon]
MFDLGQIKQLRKVLGITQHSLAKKAGVSQSIIAKIESSSIDPTYSKVCKIFESLERLQKHEELIAKQVMAESVVTISSTASIKEVISLMRQKSISQIPVLKQKIITGLITESSLLKTENAKTLQEVIEATPPIITPTTRLSAIKSILKHYSCVLVQEQGELKGIITKADLLKAII